MYVSDEYSELGQELKNGLVIDPPRFWKKFQNLAPMLGSAACATMYHINIALLTISTTNHKETSSS